MMNGATKVSTSVCGETLLTFGADQIVSCLYKHQGTGLVVVGTGNGAVRLLFPNHNYKQHGHGVRDSDVVLESEGGRKAAWGMETEEDHARYLFVVLRNRSNEAVRTAYIDDRTCKLYATIGDAAINVWDLSELEYRGDKPGTGAKSDVYAFDRSHSNGTCVNAFLFQNELEILLVVKNSVNICWVRFDEGTEANGGGDGAGNSSNGNNSPKGLVTNRLDQLKPSRTQPKQGYLSVTTPDTSLPCSFDGHYLTFLKADVQGEFHIEIRDWLTEEKTVAQNIVLKRSVFNDLTPTSVQTLDGVLIVVVSFNKILMYEISTGTLLHTMEGHAWNSRIVACRLYRIPETSKLVIVSIGTDKIVNVWSNGTVIQTLGMPSNCANFTLDGPYFIWPELRPVDGGDNQFYLESMLYNDDTGVHIAFYS